MAIEVGNVFEGRVTGVKPFGAFVALPEGRVGMVHISEVSNEYVQDINTVLHDGDTVKVQVIQVAPDGKIALSIKRLLPPPPRPAREGRVPAGSPRSGGPRPGGPREGGHFGAGRGGAGRPPREGGRGPRYGAPRRDNRGGPRYGGPRSSVPAREFADAPRDPAAKPMAPKTTERIHDGDDFAFGKIEF